MFISMWLKWSRCCNSAWLQQCRNANDSQRVWASYSFYDLFSHDDEDGHWILGHARFPFQTFIKPGSETLEEKNLFAGWPREPTCFEDECLWPAGILLRFSEHQNLPTSARDPRTNGSFCFPSCDSFMHVLFEQRVTRSRSNPSISKRLHRSAWCKMCSSCKKRDVSQWGAGLTNRNEKRWDTDNFWVSIPNPNSRVFTLSVHVPYLWVAT